MQSNEEIWKDVVGYEGLYQVSSIGRVKSLPRIKKNHRGSFLTKEIILKPCIYKIAGYFFIWLCKDGCEKIGKIHRLVAEAFHEKPVTQEKLVVNHKDFDRQNNHVYNLEWVTYRANANKKHISHSSQYTGVSWDKKYLKWEAHITISLKKKHLGYYKNELDAHYAYERKLQEITQTL